MIVYTQVNNCNIIISDTIVRSQDVINSFLLVILKLAEIKTITVFILPAVHLTLLRAPKPPSPGRSTEERLRSLQ